MIGWSNSTPSPIGFDAKTYDLWHFAQNMDLIGNDFPYAPTALNGKHAFVCGASKGIGEATAKMLNNAMKQLNPGNRKKMETEAMKDKKSFEAMVDFAKAAA